MHLFPLLHRSNLLSVYLVLYLVWLHQEMSRTQPDAAMSLTNHQWSIKKLILLFLIFVSFPLNSLIVLEETQSSVSIFHLSMTRFEKKYFRRSVVQRCFISLTLWVCLLCVPCRQVLASHKCRTLNQNLDKTFLSAYEHLRSALYYMASRFNIKSAFTDICKELLQISVGA